MEPNIAGLSRKLYDEIKQFAKERFVTDLTHNSNVRSASIFVIDKFGMYLTIIEKHVNGLPFGIPGGSIEFGEHWIDAIAREFLEETKCYIHGSVMDIYLSKKDMLLFVQINNWNDLVPCVYNKPNNTIYMAIISLQTILDATRLGEELYFTIDIDNKLKYRDPKKVKLLEDARGKQINIVQKTLFVSLDKLSVIREHGIRIRQAHRNDLNNPDVLRILENFVKKTMTIPSFLDSESSID